ncbi:MAG: hypothetical protein R6U96_14590 [Promethearchaeia archaeon]
MKRNQAPINTKQKTLNKYCPNLPDGKKHSLVAELERRENCSSEEDYSIRLELDGTIEIEETHCLTCQRRLVYNGYNERIAVLDNGLGRHEFRLHRKRCPACGEIKPDYSKLFPEYGTYHGNYKRRARQHYMEGLMPSQISRVFRIDFGVEIAKSTIFYWVSEIEDELREMLENTPVPSSGYWGYDEIHMRIAGERMYTIDTIDVNTGFVPAARISPNMGRAAGREVLMEGRKNSTYKINGIIKDMTTNLGGLFRTRCFKHIKQQNCLTHVKWAVSRHVKAFAGLSEHSQKPIPKEWRWLLSRFYDVIECSHKTDAYIQLEIVRSTIRKLKGRKKKHLITAFKTLSSSLGKIIAHQRNPWMPTTNNSLEGQHTCYTYYPSFKKRMMTPKGAQRILDYRVFRHNLRRFPGHIKKVWRKYRRFREILSDSPIKRKLAGHGNYFNHLFKKLRRWSRKYIDLWTTYFKVQ